MLQPHAPAARLHATLVMALAGPGEAGLVQVVADQRLKTLGEPAPGELHPLHRRREVVVDDAPGHPAEVGEGPHVAVEEGDLVLAVVEPDEVAARVHQPHQELPGLAALTVHLDGDLEEVDLGLVARAVHQRHVDLGALPPPLAQVAAHQRHPDLVALLAQLAVQPRRRHTLLRRRAPRPLLEQRVEARLHPFEDGLPAWLALYPHRLGQRQVAPHGVAADAQLPGDLPPAQPLDQHLVPQHVHVLHSEHPSPQPSAAPPLEMLGHAPKWITIRALFVSMVSDSVRANWSAILSFHEDTP
ncbi:MAG: hypothetical protein OXC94_02870 [Chloroflexi bacterium]|nr:hypothetical protein [Chloroflexota bacterium]